MKDHFLRTKKRSGLPVYIIFTLICANIMGTISHADAPKTCIPEAMGVPGYWNQPPDWLTAGQVLDLAYLPEDPRWRGAVSHDYGTGSTSQAEFRALYKEQSGIKYMYLSWYLKVAPAINPNEDVLFVGFSSGGSDSTIIKITLKQATTIENNNVVRPKPEKETDPFTQITIFYYTVSVFRNTGTGWSSVNPVPNWTKADTRVWIKGTSPHFWAVQMKVPIDLGATDIANGINLTTIDSFKMWYSMQEVVIDNIDNSPAIIPYTWPRTPIPFTPDYICYMNGFSYVFPDPVTHWAEASLQNPESDTGCQNGISISPSHIGTAGTANNKKIDLLAANHFYADPINYSSDSVNPGIIKATFRIANWGSQVGDVSSDSWSIIPGGKDVLDNSGIPANGGQGHITFDWTVDRNSLEHCPYVGKSGVDNIPGDTNCPNQTPTRMLHQCISVKLTGPGLNFIRDSASRNMDFIQTSTFKRNAEISVVGLPSLQSADRDVYLYLEKRNMPKFAPFSPPDKFGRIFNNDDLRGRNETKTVRENEPENSITFDDLAQTMPTYVVHAYHDTGKTVGINGTEHRVLLPQNSFGYFAGHEGDLEGWKCNLKGAGLKKISPNLYKIPVPNNGVAMVTTTIRSVDPGVAISLRGGIAIPHGFLATNFDPGFSVNVGCEILLSRHFSAEAILGYHRFQEGGIGDSINLLQFSGNWRYFYPFSSRFRTFLSGGLGVYAFDPGDTEFGCNAGLGFDFYLTNQWAVEAAYNYHYIFGEPFRFSTIQGGLRFRF